MKRSIKNLLGYTMGATDGGIGKVKEFYLDDQTWTIRYLVVETGSWLNGRKVLISPEALLVPDWENEVFPINLTKEKIKNSPDIDTEKTVSRLHEIEMYRYYPWANYWGGGIWGDEMGMAGMANLHEPLVETIRNDDDTGSVEVEHVSHLRSTHKITGYTVHAVDGKIGNIEDFIIDDHSWKLDFLVIDTANWFSGKKILISPKWIKEIVWDTAEVMLNATEDDIKNSPEYKPGQYRSIRKFL